MSRLMFTLPILGVIVMAVIVIAAYWNQVGDMIDFLRLINEVFVAS